MRLFIKATAVLLSALLLCAAFPVTAAAVIFPVRGLAELIVTDEDGAPVAGAKYSLYRRGSRYCGPDAFLGTYVTDRDGRLFASHLTNDEYFWMACGAPEGFGQDTQIRVFKLAGSGHVTSKAVLEKASAYALDFLVLVNGQNPLPSGWEETVRIVKTVNSLGDEVEVEETAYEAYLLLKAALAADGVYVDLDSAYRTVAEQQEIVVSFTEKYGEDYVKQYVAVPGYSEHHTGLALDLYLNIDGEDVYLNEDMEQYPEIWAKIHEKLADFGFILRYPAGGEAVTGYSYEPWHIRYVGVEDAQRITAAGETLEEYLGEID